MYQILCACLCSSHLPFTKWWNTWTFTCTFHNFLQYNILYYIYLPWKYVFDNNAGMSKNTKFNTQVKSWRWYYVTCSKFIPCSIHNPKIIYFSFRFLFFRYFIIHWFRPFECLLSKYRTLHWSVNVSIINCVSFFPLVKH